MEDNSDDNPQRDADTKYQRKNEIESIWQLKFHKEIPAEPELIEQFLLRIQTLKEETKPLC
jgi:hypothetical protein